MIAERVALQRIDDRSFHPRVRLPGCRVVLASGCIAFPRPSSPQKTTDVTQPMEADRGWKAAPTTARLPHPLEKHLGRFPHLPQHRIRRELRGSVPHGSGPDCSPCPRLHTGRRMRAAFPRFALRPSPCPFPGGEREQGERKRPAACHATESPESRRSLSSAPAGRENRKNTPRNLTASVCSTLSVFLFAYTRSPGRTGVCDGRSHVRGDERLRVDHPP